MQSWSLAGLGDPAYSVAIWHEIEGGGCCKCPKNHWLAAGLDQEEEGRQTCNFHIVMECAEIKSGALLLWKLVSLLETKKACLRVRVTQLRCLQASVKSKTINIAYRRQGLSCLLHGGSGVDRGAEPPSASEVSDYWNSVIGIQGQWDPHHYWQSDVWVKRSLSQGGGTCQHRAVGACSEETAELETTRRNGICGF